VITFLINRARRHWQVLSTLVFGVIISTAFLASGPLLVNTVMNFALPHKIRSSLVENGSIFLSTYNNQGAETFEELDSEITNILVKNISEISEVFHGISSPWAFPLEEDALIADERINLRSFPGIESRIEIISGSWPCDSELEISSFQALISKQISAVDDISFEVDDGKLALIRGRSGSGKTTLLNLIAALDQPIRGNIHIGNLFSCPTVLMMSLVS
jgi:ABC-type bacteriocin/lantibiotic exporter with double-glycine peptidase domain